MARKLTLLGRTYSMETNQKKDAVTVIECFVALIGVVRRTENGRWKYGTHRVWETPLAAAKEMIRDHDARNRIMLDEAWEMALGRERKDAETKEHAIKVAESNRRRAEAEALRRATNPMLTVVKLATDGFAYKAGDPREVILYGDPSDRVSIEYSTDWSKPLGELTRPLKATVNWSAKGSTDVQGAREYALAILRAADEAESWNMNRAATPAQEV